MAQSLEEVFIYVSIKENIFCSVFVLFVDYSLYIWLLVFIFPDKSLTFLLALRFGDHGLPSAVIVLSQKEEFNNTLCLYAFGIGSCFTYL